MRRLIFALLMTFEFGFGILFASDAQAWATEAGWGACGGPVGPTTQYSAPSTPESVAWGRFRRRRWSPPDFINPAPAVETKPAATPATEAPERIDVTRRHGDGTPTVITGDGDPFPTGVDWSKIPKVERATLDGRPIPKPEAIRIVETSVAEPDTRIPDDAKLVRLTAIGTPAETVALTEDLDKAKELAALKGRCVVQVYDSGDDKGAWAVKRYGFLNDAHPSIYVQKPDGQVLARLDHYPGAQVMAATLTGAVRKTDPSYDPKKDPDPTTPPPLPSVPVPVLILGGAAGLALLLKPKS
jgi:hypothetical protein